MPRETGTDTEFEDEAYFRALAWQEDLLARWRWSQALVPGPLCLVAGVS